MMGTLDMPEGVTLMALIRVAKTATVGGSIPWPGLEKENRMCTHPALLPCCGYDGPSRLGFPARTTYLAMSQIR